MGSSQARGKVGGDGQVRHLEPGWHSRVCGHVRVQTSDCALHIFKTFLMFILFLTQRGTA